MSNRVTIIRTKFEDCGGTSYGFRAYDDFDQAYNNNFESPLPEDKQELLNVVVKHADKKLSDMLSFCQESQKGIYLDDDWIDWEELEPMLKKAEEARFPEGT